MPEVFQECKVITNDQLNHSRTYKLVLEAEKIYSLVRPGQFVTLPPLNSGDTFRRPFSVYSVGNRTITIVYQVVGKNTECYSRLTPGEKIDVLGPCGQPINLKPDTKQLILIGGGCGAASLNLLARSHPQMYKMIGLGFKSENLIFGLDDFEQTLAYSKGELHWATEDAGSGKPKNAAELFVRILISQNLDQDNLDRTIVVTCGPRPMMEKVAQIAAQRNLSCLVGMEDIMGCGGIGSCKSCAIHLVDGQVLYVCQHGPFFPAEEVFKND